MSNYGLFVKGKMLGARQRNFPFYGFPSPDIHIHLYQQLQQWLRGLLFLKSLAGCLFVALLLMMRFIRHHSLQQHVFLLAALRLMLPNTYLLPHHTK